MNLIRRFRYTLTFLAIFFLWVLLRPDPAPQTYELRGETMGTTYNVRLWQFPEDREQEAFATEIQNRLTRLDRELMSLYADDSEVSRFNRAPPGEWYPVSVELVTVVQVAQQVSELSQGYFDITVAPLVQRWGFASERGAADEQRLPDTGEIESLRSRVDYRRLDVRQDPPALRKSAPLEIDLGGIAKGYAADHLADFFDSLDLGSYFIEVGGELRVRGNRPDGSAWIPAIERPGEGRSVHEILTTGGEALGVAGSGDYRNYFEVDGQRYSHEIDPHTGRPVEHELAAVYVIDPSATVADAWTTAFMAMGLERGRELATRYGLAAYFIYRPVDGTVLQEHVTPLFEGYLER